MSTRHPARPVTLWTGWIAFAAVMISVVGLYNLLTGLAAATSDDVYVTTPGLVILLDVTTWGWIHAVWGALLLVTGVATLLGKAWGRYAALGLVTVNMVTQLVLLPAYPFFAVVTIALEVLVVWAIVVHGEELERL